MDKDMEDVDKRYEWLHSEHSSSAGDIFGEPKSKARIGDEYQAQIPFLMTENEEQITTSENRFRFGLSIPVTWIHNQHKNKKGTKGKSGILDSLVPGSSSESWSEIEHDSFLLGLYIFGKNLRLVNKFVGNKGMRNVLCYYYGKFYRSGEHQKWSRFRKKRSRKSVPGKKIFNGWRRLELLSRLLPNLTDESKTNLTQVTRTFEEEKISFEKYVLTVRDTVGMNLLVEAIAIGKGKRDLTGRAKKSKVKSACSSLKPEEILNLLKDGIGLSKERLNDIFWEAVWPRLLAKGWHSEQPRNYTFQNSKKQLSLVFLAPGVTKFSRRSLEKGCQYFESFTDVLNKVVSEPSWLLEEHGHDRERVVEQQGLDDKENLMKCTIVDTSSVGVVRVREVPAVTQQSSSGETTEESQNEDVNPEVVDCETSAVNNVSPVAVRKLKLICKPIAKHNCEDEGCKKKSRGIVIDLNSPRVGPDSDAVLRETTTNQPEESTNGQRQSKRNRPLSTKALEALANGFLSPKKKNNKKRRGPEDKDRMRRRVRAKTALVSSCGAPFNGPSCMGMGMVTESNMK